jgi:type IV pilus assembly protein PilM
LFGLGNKTSLLGVDVGESSIKMVQLEHLNKKFRLAKFHIEPMPRGLIVEGRVMDVSQLSETLQRVLKEQKISVKAVVASVNYTDVIVKRLRSKKGMRERELEQWVEYEVDKFVPYTMDELNLDFEIDEAQSNELEDEIVVTACRKQAVEGIVECVEKAGLEPYAVDISNQALLRAGASDLEGFAGGGLNDLTAIIDVGMSTTRFYVFSGQNMVYHRDEAFGANYLIDDFASEYKISADKAHAMLYKNKMPKAYKENVLKPYVKSFLNEIERGMYAFESSGTRGQIARVLLVGGSVQIPDIENILSKKLRIDVKLMNPLASIKKPSRINANMLNEFGPQLAHACGLAMWKGPK